MMKRFLTVLALAVAVAGCGGVDASEPAATSEQVTSSEAGPQDAAREAQGYCQLCLIATGKCCTVPGCGRAYGPCCTGRGHYSGSVFICD